MGLTITYGKGKTYGKFSKYKRKKKKGKKKSQKVTVKAVKTIVKKAIAAVREVNYATTVQTTLLSVGNPLLEKNGGSFTDESVPKPRCILLTDYEMTHFLDKNLAVVTPTNQSGDISYLQKQKLTIKGIQMKIEVRSPSTKIGTKDCSQWCDFHWAIIRTSKAIDAATGRLVTSLLFKDDWYQSTGSYVRSDQCNRSGYSIVKQGQFSCAPIKSPVNLQDFSYKIIRKTINVSLKKTINLQRKESPVDPVHFTDATLAGNINSSNYWVVFYVNQEHQNVNSSDYKYTNGSVSDPSNISASCFVKYKITLSGYGQQD